MREDRLRGRRAWRVSQAAFILLFGFAFGANIPLWWLPGHLDVFGIRLSRPLNGLLIGLGLIIPAVLFSAWGLALMWRPGLRRDLARAGRHPASALLAALTGVALVAALRADRPGDGWRFVVTQVVGLGLYFYALSDPGRGRLFQRLFIGLIMFQAAIGLAQFALQRDLGLRILYEFRLDPAFPVISATSAPGEGRLVRAYGLTRHPNILGGYVAVALILLTGNLVLGGRGAGGKGPHPRPLSPSWERGETPPLLAMGCLLLLAGLLATLSRSAWLGVTAGLALLLGLTWRRGMERQNRRWFRWLGGAGVAVILIFLGLFGSWVASRLWLVGNRLEVWSIDDRMIQIRAALDLIAHHPWLGAGDARFVAASNTLSSATILTLPVHNVPLLVAAELGIPAAVVLIAFSAIPIVSLFSRWQRLARRPAALLYLSAWVCLGIISLFDFYLWPVIDWAPWLLVTTLAGLITRDIQEQRIEHASYHPAHQ